MYTGRRQAGGRQASHNSVSGNIAKLSRGQRGVCLALSRERGRPNAWEEKREQPALENSTKFSRSAWLSLERPLQAVDENRPLISRSHSHMCQVPHIETNRHLQYPDSLSVTFCCCFPLHIPLTSFFYIYLCIQQHDLHQYRGTSKLTGNGRGSKTQHV